MSELKTKALTIGYGKKALVEDIEITAVPGKIVCLIGPNGSGKSTLLKTASGNQSPLKGVVYIDGKNLSDMKLSDRAEKFSFMTTERVYTEYTSCFEVVSVGRYRYTGIFGKLSEADKNAVDEALKITKVYDIRDSNFSKISDGQRQRVLLARALVQEPGLLILDEPTGFLDIGGKLDFAENLKNIVREKNIAVLMSMHELELVKSIADIVVCVGGDGRIDRIGTAEEIITAEYIEKLFSISPGLLSGIYDFIKKKNN